MVRPLCLLVGEEFAGHGRWNRRGLCESIGRDGHRHCRRRTVPRRESWAASACPCARPAFAGDERLASAVDIHGLNPGYRIIMVSVDPDAANRDDCRLIRRRQLRPKDRDATQTSRGNHLAVSRIRTANRRLPPY